PCPYPTLFRSWPRGSAAPVLGAPAAYRAEEGGTRCAGQHRRPLLWTGDCGASLGCLSPTGGPRAGHPRPGSFPHPALYRAAALAAIGHRPPETQRGSMTADRSPFALSLSVFLLLSFGLSWLLALPLWLGDGLEDPLFYP